VSTQNLISIEFHVRLVMSLDFIAREYGLAATSTRLLWVALHPLLADPYKYVFVGFCLGRGCWVGVTMIASGLLNFRRCCALRMKGKSLLSVSLLKGV